MTVKQLMRELSKLPEDATITVMNNGRYYNGEYKAVEVAYVESSDTVAIVTDYAWERIITDG